MKQLAFVTLVTACLFAVLAVPTFSEGDSLDTTVTPLVLSVNIGQDTVDYGVMALSTADNARSSKATGFLSATNTGSIAADLLIEGTNATSAVAETEWTLNCTPEGPGTVGPNQFVHRFLVGATDWATGQALCLGATKFLAEDVPATTGTVEFKLQMNMPTSTTGYSQRSSTVIITAVEPTP